MEDIAFVALLVFLVLAALAFNLIIRSGRRRELRAEQHPVWRIEELSSDGVTHVYLRKIVRFPSGRDEVVDSREVGSVNDNDNEYDDKLLTLRATAQQRRAVVDTSF